MKKLILTISGSLFLLLVNAQEARLTLDGNNYQGTKLNNGIIDFAGANAMLLPNEKLAKIRNELEFLRIQAHEDSIQIAEYKKIITAYESFEKGADTLVKNQKAMLIVADSLYTGYKALYKDLKKLCDINTFSVTPGIGLVNIPDIDPDVSLIFNAGFEYNKININALVGKKYQGLTVGYRIGF